MKKFLELLPTALMILTPVLLLQLTIEHRLTAIETDIRWIKKAISSELKGSLKDVGKTCFIDGPVNSANANPSLAGLFYRRS